MKPLRSWNLNRARWVLGALLGCAVVGTGADQAAAQETNRVARPDYATFRIVTERNIFNANRIPGVVRTNRGPRNTSRADAFRLVGIIEYNKGEFAFFDGTSSDYRKALQCQGTIAGYVLTNITAQSVTLEAEGKKIELKVGMQVRREDNGEWQLAAASDLPAVASGGSGGGGDSAPAEGGSGDSGGEVSEVLKKLMQQREQE